ncbi:MAG: sel1 repeat family protein [Holosporales bacterium]|jgi:TPR repeat protein|nr:sel1 repeat family protein [Holosporales bacterium]
MLKKVVLCSFFVKSLSAFCCTASITHTCTASITRAGALSPSSFVPQQHGSQFRRLRNRLGHKDAFSAKAGTDFARLCLSGKLDPDAIDPMNMLETGATAGCASAQLMLGMHKKNNEDFSGALLLLERAALQGNLCALVEWSALLLMLKSEADSWMQFREIAERIQNKPISKMKFEAKILKIVKRLVAADNEAKRRYMLVGAWLGDPRMLMQSLFHAAQESDDRAFAYLDARASEFSKARESVTQCCIDCAGMTTDPMQELNEEQCTYVRIGIAILNVPSMQHTYGRRVELSSSDWGAPVTTNPSNPAYYYKKAAQGGYIQGRVELSRLLILGQGFPADPQKGYALLQPMLEAGDIPEALNNAGVMCELGLMPQAEKRQAYQWYRRAMVDATSLGGRAAHYNCARCLAFGVGVGCPKSIASAMQCIGELDCKADPRFACLKGDIYEQKGHATLSEGWFFRKEGFQYFKTARSMYNQANAQLDKIRRKFGDDIAVKRGGNQVRKRLEHANLFGFAYPVNEKTASTFFKELKLSGYANYLLPKNSSDEQIDELAGRYQYNESLIEESGDGIAYWA